MNIMIINIMVLSSLTLLCKIQQVSYVLFETF